MEVVAETSSRVYGVHQCVLREFVWSGFSASLAFRGWSSEECFFDICVNCEGVFDVL